MRSSIRRLILSLVFAACIIVQCFAQKQPRAPIDALVGPVRSLQERNMSSNGRRRLSSVEFYDQNGSLIKYTTYKDEGGILYSDTNTYDAAGRLIETRTAHSEYVYLPDKQVHIYDDRGNVSEVKGFNSAGRQLGGHLYLYDSRGNMTEDRNYFIGKSLVYGNNHVTRHTYDAKGNEISRQQFVYDEDGTRPDEFGMGYQKQVFLNDGEGRPTLIGFLKADDRLVRTESIKYDRRGNTLEDIERSVAGRLLRKVSYSYVFDRHGNWIKQVRREWTGGGVGSVFEPLEITLRAITYYPRPYKKKEP